MKFIVKIFIIMFTTMVLSMSAFAESKTEQPIYGLHYDDQRNPFDDATAALKLASETNRNVLMVVGGNWCAFCKKMEAFWQSNDNVSQALHSKYVILKINVSDENKNKEFMSTMPPVFGYPHIYISTAKGKVLLSKDTAELQIDTKHDEALWLAFIDKWQAETNQQVALN